MTKKQDQNIEGVREVDIVYERYWYEIKDWPQADVGTAAEHGWRRNAEDTPALFHCAQTFGIPRVFPVPSSVDDSTEITGDSEKLSV